MRFFQFFSWVLVFIIILCFLPFQFFYLSCLYFGHFSNFVSFIFDTIFVLNISHFIIILSFQSQNFSFSQILSSIDIWLFGPAHVFYVYCYSFQFFSWFLVFIIILYFLPFSVFLSYFSFLYFSFFPNFGSFTFKRVSILSISHFIFF